MNIYIFDKDNMPSIEYFKDLKCSPALKQQLLKRHDVLLKNNGKKTTPEELSEKFTCK